jgi:glycosyltransferase involved in cell wall biosynthesis
MAVRARLASRPADILYLDSVSIPSAIILATLAARVKVVVRLSYLEGQPHPGLFARILFNLPRVGPILCDISPENARDPLTARWLGGKIEILPLAHNTDWYEQDVDLQEFGVPAGAFSVASVSEGSGDSGLRWLIACAHWVPMDLPIHFLLVAPASRHDQLRRLIRKMPFTQRFHLCDQLEASPGLLALSSVAVITDWGSELQRRACMQCLAVGVPVLAADSTQMRQVVQPEVNGELIASTDPESLAHSIFELFENQKRRAVLSSGAKRTARQWPSLHQQLLQMHSAFEQVVGGRPAP